MLLEEHIETAKDFLVASDKEFEAGDYLQASEKLWGAASQAVIALAKRRGSPDSSHGALRTLIFDLPETEGGPALRAGFVAAEKVHANFYHGFMDYGDEFALSRQVVHEFVNAVLGLVNGEAQAQNGQDSG